MNRLPVLDRLADSIVRRVSGESGRHKMAKRRFHDALSKRWPWSFQAQDPGPPAPEHLLRTTAGMTEAEVKKWLNPDFYFRTGYEQMREFILALDAVSFNIRTVGTTFELGCGSGRLLRLLRCIHGIRLVGSDVNGDCINWCREHLPGIDFFQNDLTPPLAFLEAASVDLVIASSVFTHIQLNQQRPWLEELYRIMRPGGIFLCTVLGQSYEKAMLGTEDRKKLKQDGHLVLDAQNRKASLATQRAGSCDIFQTRSEVVTVFGSVFHMLDYIDCGAGGQDLLILLKPR